MIPLRDENPTHRVPWLTLALIAANVAVFVYELTLTPIELEIFWMRWALVPARFLADPFSPAQAVTLLSSMFLHAGWIHVGSNMLYLWIFGNNVEDRFGPLGFAAFYVTCGLAAGAAQIAAAPSAALPILGASGAVAGVLGAYLLLYPGASVITIIPVFFFIEVAAVPAYLVIGFWFVLQVASGLVSVGHGVVQTGGVAWFAHIGGFVMGLVLAVPAAVVSHRAARRQGENWG